MADGNDKKTCLTVKIITEQKKTSDNVTRFTCITDAAELVYFRGFFSGKLQLEKNQFLFFNKIKVSWSENDKKTGFARMSSETKVHCSYFINVCCLVADSKC